MESFNFQMSPELEQIHSEVQDHFRALTNGFQKLDKIIDQYRKSRQLDVLTGKMRECKRLLQEFERKMKDEGANKLPEVTKELKDTNQSMIKELNSYVALRKSFKNSMENNRVELLDDGAGASEIRPHDDNVQLASEMSNQGLINAGMNTIDDTDHAIQRSKMVVEQTVGVGTQTAATLKDQTDKMGRIVNELDTIRFSIKKVSRLVKEIGRRAVTDKFIIFFLFLTVCGVIAIIIVKVINPKNKGMRDIPGLAPPSIKETIVPDSHFSTVWLKREGRFKRFYKEHTRKKGS